MVSREINLAMRALEFLWTLLIMSLVGNMIATSFAGNHSIVNYDMFVSVFAMLSLFYLIPATINVELTFHPIIVIVLDALDSLLFLIGGIATANYLGIHRCSNDAYTSSNPVTNGSPNMEKRCREAQASTVFLWFGFAAFLVSTIMSGLQHRGSANVPSGSIRRSGPAKSQV